MTMRARFVLLLALVVASWLAVPLGLALAWVAGRLLASMLGWA